jgi:hypothetical protein
MEYPLPNQIYKHYKGGTYQVITLSTHTETGEILVIYKSVSLGTFFAIPIQSWSAITESVHKQFELVS